MKPAYTLFTYFLIIIFALTMYACTCSECGQDELQIPQHILDKADEFIASHTGSEFKKLYITPDFVNSKFDTPYYYIVYRFQIPDKEYVDETIEFSMDSSGNIIMNRDIIGLPDCLNTPEYCMFNIDEVQAKNIAKEKGFEQGIKDWKIGFMWDQEYKRYIWRILSTTSEKMVDNSFRGSGQEMIIDPNSGEVLKTNKWNVR